ncbi:hypothetical protein [Paraburkholderia sp. RL17-381-BIF-C]|jgi:hypothetical protein|uniref:hypothetical protein n=1 Tax=Paraburkholderia sp. RL17-381-BIF-C TaxID=3031635 RepID=UPI0038B7C6A5
MNLFFWMLLNLGVPIIGPIFTLTLVAPAHGWRVAKALIAGSVKDGQLFWCAMPRRNSLFADGSFSPTEIVLSVFFTVIAVALLASLHVQPI